MKYRFTPSFQLDVKASDDERGIIEGLASTFGGPPDAHGDIIAPGAFSKSLRERTPVMYWSHDQSEPIGKWLDVRETRDGLAVRGKLTLGTKRGAEAYALAQDDVLALSIGFVVPPGGKSYDGDNRVLTELELYEISLTALPANSRARITAVKTNQLDITSPREVQNALRAAGLSNRQVKRLMREGYSAMLKTDDDEQLEALANQFAEIAHILRA